MNPNDSIETTAPTVDQAVNQALAQLGAEQDDVKIEVLITPRAGVLGLGARQARVRVTRRVPEGASTGVTSPPPAPPVVRESISATATPVRPEPTSSTTTSKEPLIPTVAATNEAEVSEIEQEGEIEEEPVGAEELSARPDRAEPAVLAREATAIMARILELMGEKAKIEIVEDSSAENVELNIKGDGSGLLIGRHGQTLDALEYVVNRILARQLKDAAAPISIDTESYRARRRRQLHRMALAKGEQAKREHLAVALDPMPPRDRRIIHLALKDDPLVTTRSSGDGFLRSVEIMPVDERREGAGARGRDRQRERGRESGRDREHTTPGQQGGFKHGQKRIV
ncbi:MAG: Jag N-terminal domain-containing protein [Deltaproteobacteria bacterium]|nr:Jag N-terminal domain-containing protein [Deltaproteobacteria bacterium]